MSNDSARLIKDVDKKIPVPQYKSVDSGLYEKHYGKHAPFYQLIDDKGNIIGRYNPLHTQSVLSVQEQRTESDLIEGALSFSEGVSYIEIYNTDEENMGVFNVNGIDIHVPQGKTFEAKIGGVPYPVVTVSGSTSFILTRYE